VRKEGEKAKEKLFTACTMLVNELSSMAAEAEKEKVTKLKTAKDSAATDSVDVEETKKKERTQYDVFISYAHRTPTEAMKLYVSLLDIDPALKVFLDRSELRTGISLSFVCLGFVVVVCLFFFAIWMFILTFTHF
jgi:hypothetical protein